MPAPRRTNGQGGVLAALNAAAPEKVPINWIPLDRYYRSASLLQRQAEQYRRNGNKEQLYVMLLRFANLALKTIPKHSAYNANDAQAMHLRSVSRATIPELEALQSELKMRENFAVLERSPFEARAAPPDAIKLSAGHVPGLHWEGADDGRPLPPAAALDSGFASALENLGRPGWTPDGGAATSTTAAPAALVAMRSPALPDLTPSIALPQASQAALDKHAIMPVGMDIGRIGSASSTQPQASSHAAAAHAPALPQPQPQQQPQHDDAYYSRLIAALQIQNVPSVSQPPIEPSPYAMQLQLGPQEIGVHGVSHPVGPPPADATCCPPGPPNDYTELVPASKAGGVSELKRRKSLRDVYVSKALMDEFLRFAASNTRRSVETCGILAGTLSPDESRFTVTALIVPKQEGTSDTVQALAEEEIFEAQDSRSLYPLGWIHTHPSQSCFLSSIDVHTHCGYQTMLDEAIAIVMAPRDARTPVGIFRLSTPGGLSLVQKCPHRGFHTHPPTETGQALYELCGHVYLNPRVDFEVVDLRNT